jgi:peptidyl-prolyl cis-trans isomerase C
MMGTLQRPVSAGPASASPQEVAAQVNGKSITYQELNAEFLARTKARFESVQNNPRAQQARKEILDDIINGELLVQEAERQKIRVAPQAIEERFEDIRARFPSEEAFKQYLGASGLTPERLKARIRDELLRQRLITKEILEGVSVSPQELETFFNDHRDDYSQEEEVHVRHILVVVTPDASPEEDQKAKDRAKAVLAKARKGEDFAKLATEYSDGPTKAREGDLGYFGRGQTVKPFEEAAFKLKVGEISDLVRTQFGYHIIKAEGRREAKQLSFTEAKDQVREDLTREKTYTRYQDYLKELRRKSKLTVNLR